MNSIRTFCSLVFLLGLALVPTLAPAQEVYDGQNVQLLPSIFEAAERGDTASIEPIIKKLGPAPINSIERGTLRSPLHLAAMGGHMDTVERLVMLGARINLPDLEGKTPLHYAALNGHMATVERLVRLGAKINQADNLNKTPLHYAAAKGHDGTVQVLLRMGADPNARDRSGMTPRDEARAGGHLATVAALGVSSPNTSNSGLLQPATLTPQTSHGIFGNMGLVEWIILLAGFAVLILIVLAAALILRGLASRLAPRQTRLNDLGNASLAQIDTLMNRMESRVNNLETILTPDPTGRTGLAGHENKRDI